MRELTRIRAMAMRLKGTRPGCSGNQAVSEVVAGLQTMAGQLPQLLAQLASWLIIEGDGGRIEHDSGEPARPWIGRVIAGLSDASAAADEMAAALTEAHGATGGLRTPSAAS